MISKKITHKDEMYKHIREGVSAVATIVGRTLGPGGLPILIERTGQALNGEPLPPMITKDGVTVAAECASSDPEVDVVIQAVKDICRKTNKVAGDGPQPLYSKVLTPKGFVEMGTLEIGMEICGTNGTIQKVLGVFPKGEKEIYTVEFANNRTVECCGEHLWEVVNTGTLHNNKELKTTEQLSKDYIVPKASGEVKRRYYTPRSAVEFYDSVKEMPLDPYLVGVLLGDGSLSGTGTIEISLGIKKKHVINKLNLPKGFFLSSSYVEERNYFRVKILGKDEQGKSIAEVLKSIGLLGVKSNNKFIPKSYLYSSSSVRNQLLQGLLDTDGYINSRDLFEFSSISKELADDFVELCHSLGKTVSINKHLREEGKSYSMTPIYRVAQLKGYKFGNRLDKVTATGRKTTMQCIKVSNPDNLYITNDYIATHNTTTAVVLGNALLDEALKAVEEHNLNPQQVRLSLESAIEEVIDLLKAETVECKTFDMIEHVATISANGDSEIGSVIRRAFEAVGTDGVITIDEGTSQNHTLEVVDGFQIRRGAEAQDRFFNNSERTKFEVDGCHVLMYDGKLNQANQVLDVLKMLYEKYQGKMPPVLFMANEFSMETLQVMLINKAEMGLSVCAIRTPHQTKVTTAMLDDMAVFLGGERLGNGNRNLNNVEFEDIGICDKVTVDKYTTTFFGGHGSEEDVLKRIDQLKAQRSEAESPYDAALLSDRIASLAEGIAKIGVGGLTDFEVKEKYHRIEDAVNASRAAISEGVIPGGGATLFRIARKLDDTTVGREILKVALTSPFETIMSNLGLDASYVDTSGAQLLKSTTCTYDGVIGQIVNALEVGIIDPVKVTKTALRNACSIAALLTTCGGAITYERPKS